MTALVLEDRTQPNLTPRAVMPGGAVLEMTPPIDEDYWAYRVRLSATQAIVGFPKFGTVGIGFAKEEDWNTNLPYISEAEEIYEHISHSKGDDTISREDCLTAIRMIQDAVAAARAGQ